ncbi:hypothetical protein J2X08_002503 [Rhizobium rosettiformans]|nr:hypothetical protein [Rhizobium rosettiformans]MDR7065005.1 hypothetical protein [Rhizobium rosettiformans]
MTATAGASSPRLRGEGRVRGRGRTDVAVIIFGALNNPSSRHPLLDVVALADQG